APVRRRSSSTSAWDDGPAGLSTSTTPTGLAARGITSSGLANRCEELAPDELHDLLEVEIAGEARGLHVAPALGLTRDRRDVALVGRGAKRHPVLRGAGVRGRLADERNELRPLTLPQVVDDPFGVRLFGSGVGEVGALEVRDHEPVALEGPRMLERPREE